MKRKFVKVTFFGALALSTVTYVGCNDYDDDIKSVQEQIDQIKSNNPVSVRDMQTCLLYTSFLRIFTYLFFQTDKKLSFTLDYK